MTAHQRQTLDEDGYILLPNYFADRLTALRQQVEDLFVQEGDRAGSEFKQEPGCRRLANLVDKGAIFREIMGDAGVLEVVGQVLGPRFKLSSMNVRSVNPRWPEAQPLHADMGAIADEQGYWVCNTVWMLDDFTADNGPLRAVPGSHRWRKLPQETLADPRSPHPDEVVIHGPAGSVIVMNAHLWHSGLANHTDRSRTALHAFFCRSDKPQQQYQKRLLRPETQASLTPAQRKLLALDDSANDELSSRERVLSGFLK